VATEDGVSEVFPSLSLPRAPGDTAGRHEVHASILHGGRITELPRTGDNHFQYRVELPRTLSKGDSHEYTVEYTLPVNQPMSPHYAVIAFRRCTECEIIVRFDTARLPEAVWCLDGVPPRVVDSSEPAGPPLWLDDIGEITLRFTNLTYGHGYGMAWAPSGTAHPSPEDDDVTGTKPPVAATAASSAASSRSL
jgi:hypothetical protein